MLFKSALILISSLALVVCDFDVVCPMDSDDGFSIYIPDPYDCSKFFQCVGNVPTHLICPDPLQFDPVLNVCNWEWEVDCTPLEPPTSESPDYTTESSDYTTDSDEEYTTESNVTTQEVSKDNADQFWSWDTEERNFDVICPLVTDGSTVYVPHPYDCTKFYVCLQSTPILLDCPGGLEFDSVLNVCNWPQNANCEPLPMPGTTEEPDVTTEEPDVTTEEPDVTTEETDVTTEETDVTTEKTVGMDSFWKF